MVQKITNFHLNQARKTENEGVMIESERQSKRYASGGNRDSERWSTWCMCVTKRENKQTMQCVLHRQTILLSASFTLLFVFIPASISKTWLKCSSYQRLCWTTGEKKKKDSEMGRKMKRKSQKHLLQRDAFHPSQAARRKDRHSNFILFPSLLLCLFHPFSSAAEPPRYLHLKLNSLPRTTFQSHFFSLFQSIDIIPSALFSPITLCHAVIWGIGTVPWLGLREECGGLGRCYRSSMCYLETSRGNSAACALFNFSWSARLIVLSGEKKTEKSCGEKDDSQPHLKRNRDSGC